MTPMPTLKNPRRTVSGLVAVGIAAALLWAKDGPWTAEDVPLLKFVAALFGGGLLLINFDDLRPLAVLLIDKLPKVSFGRADNAGNKADEPEVK